MRRSGIGSVREVSVNEIVTRVLRVRGLYGDGIGMTVLSIDGIQRLIDDTMRMIGVVNARDRVIIREIDEIGVMSIAMAEMKTPVDVKVPSVAATKISVLATERYLYPFDLP
jgi:hypothetical protein